MRRPLIDTQRIPDTGEPVFLAAPRRPDMRREPEVPGRKKPRPEDRSGLQESQGCESVQL